MVTRKEQKELRREQILKIALDEFVNKGFYGTSTTIIASRCQMSSGLMFHYFDSKEKLYLALIEQASSQMSVLNTSISEKATPLKLLEEVGRFTLQMFSESPDACKMFVFIKQVMLSQLDIPGVNGALQKMDMISNLSELIRIGQQLGEIREGNPVAMSTLFLSSLQGVGEMYYRYPHLPLPDAEWLISFMRK